jgi:tocopherol O-methyltransferase
VLVVTWCHRVLGPDEAALRPNEAALLDRICEAYYLPAWCSVADYQRLFGEWWVVRKEGRDVISEVSETGPERSGRPAGD